MNKYNEENPDNIISFNRENIKETYYQFYDFIRYKALKDCILDFYIEQSAKPNELKNYVDELEYEHKFDLNNLKKLLDDIADKAKAVEDIFINTRSSMAAKHVMRGSRSITKYYPTHLSKTGYYRDVTPTGYDYPTRRRIF